MRTQALFYGWCAEDGVATDGGFQPCGGEGELTGPGVVPANMLIHVCLKETGSTGCQLRKVKSITYMFPLHCAFVERPVGWADFAAPGVIAGRWTQP